MHQEFTITLHTPVCAGGSIVFSGVAGIPVAGEVISLRGEKVMPGFWIAPLETVAAIGKFFSVAVAASDRLYSYYEEKAAGFAVTVKAALCTLRKVCGNWLRQWAPVLKKVAFQRRMNGLSRAGGLRL